MSSPCLAGGVQFQVLQFSVSDPVPPVPKGPCTESMRKDLDFCMYDSGWEGTSHRREQGREKQPAGEATAEQGTSQGAWYRERAKRKAWYVDSSVAYGGCSREPSGRVGTRMSSTRRKTLNRSRGEAELWDGRRDGYELLGGDTSGRHPLPLTVVLGN